MNKDQRDLAEEQAKLELVWSGDPGGIKDARQLRRDLAIGLKKQDPDFDAPEWNRLVKDNIKRLRSQ